MPPFCTLLRLNWQLETLPDWEKSPDLVVFITDWVTYAQGTMR